MKGETHGKVYLVGAGPGAPDLITLRALNAISNADVILYDRLIHPELLEYASPSAKRIYVGKKSGENSDFRQGAIYALMIAHARRGKLVVRLKGGDPFVFGRGGEEASVLRSEGIPFEIIPGISSAIAVPECAGIPVTHRGVSSSFAVFAGHESADDETTGIDWNVAANVSTSIFLMGVERLPGIVSNLLANGRKGGTPAAIISRGTLAEQCVISGFLDNIIEKSTGVSPPAVIVVGEVVKLGEFLRNGMDIPSVRAAGNSSLSGVM